jgi:O-antigen ligase
MISTPLDRAPFVALSLRQWMGLAIVQGGLLSLLFMEAYAALAILAAALILMPVMLGRTAHAVILLPLFLYAPIHLPEGMGLQISEAAVLLLMLSAVGGLLTGPVDRKYVFPALAPIALIIIGGLLSINNARFPVVSGIILLKHVEAFVVVYFITVNFVNKKEDLRSVILAIAFGGLLAAAYGILRFSQGLEARVFALHGGLYGAFIGTAVIAALSMIFFGRRSALRYVLLMMLPVMILALLLSQTRAWTFGTLLALSVMIFSNAAKSRRLKLIFGVTLLAVVIVWLVQTGVFGLASSGAVEGATQKALQTGVMTSDDKGKLLSSLLRLVNWWHGLNIYVQHPILGFGIGNLRFRNMVTGELGPADEENMGFVDNHYLNALYETGILGAVGWIALMIMIYRECRKLSNAVTEADERAIAYAIMGALVLWSVGGMFWTLNNVHESTVMLAFLIGLLFASRRIIHRAPGASPAS